MHRKIFRDRKSIRKPGHNYSGSCVYFITVCVDFYMECFGSVQNDAMNKNEYGKIIKQQWLWIAKQYPYVSLDAFVIMPNHFHGIIAIDNPNENNYEPDMHSHTHVSNMRVAPLTEIIGAFKSTSSKFIHHAGFIDFKWQRSFYDHIIRDIGEFAFIRDYIKNNPINWEYDPENTRMQNRK